MRLAIDPGCSGGIVVEGGAGVEAYGMPATTDALVRLIRHVTTSPRRSAHIESLIKYTGFNMTGSSMAVYAKNWGNIEGILKAFDYTVHEIHPKTWQKAVGLVRLKGESTPDWKRRLKAEAQKLFPNKEITLKTADAYLIYYATRPK